MHRFVSHISIDFKLHHDRLHPGCCARTTAVKFCVPDGGRGSIAAKKGAGFQRPWPYSGRVRGGITQLPGDATAVIDCWAWVKRALILPILQSSDPWIVVHKTSSISVSGKRQSGVTINEKV